MDKRFYVVDVLFYVIRKTLSEMGYQHILKPRTEKKHCSPSESISQNLIILDITMPGKSGIEVLENSR